MQARREYGRLAGLFLLLGIVGFGGASAHLSMMEEEFVRRRAWLSREEFLDLMGAANLLPGPNSTQVAFALGLLRAGIPGMLISGICFILPAALLSSGLGELYCRFGALPALAPVLVATKAAIVGVMLGTAVRMAPAATKSLFLACVGIAMVGASVYLEVPPLITLLGAGAISALGTRSAHATGALPFLLIKRAAAGGVAAGATATAAASFGGIFLYFLFVGSTIYGGAFVLVSYLHSGLVDRLHWLTDRQLMDAITVGQLTPGPVFCTASFAGYLLRGPGGAALATLGIFAPCLVLVPLMKRFVGWTRSHALAGAFLDGVGVGAIALMLSIGIKLAPQAAGSWALGILAAMAGLATLIRLNAGFVVLAAGLAGWMLHLT